MMKWRAGQAGRLFADAVHQLGRIVMLLLTLGLGAAVLLAFRLSLSPIELPGLASRLATGLSAPGISVQVDGAELAWEGYHGGAGVPVSLRVTGIHVRNAVGTALADIPQAHLTIPPADLFGAREPFQLQGSGARFLGTTAPVSLSAALWPGPGMTIEHGSNQITLGAGRVGMGAWAEDITSGAFTVDISRDAVSVTHGALELARHGGGAPHVTAVFAATRAADGWTGTLTLGGDAVQAQDLGTYWPAPAVPDTRRWVLAHITAGTARNPSFSFVLHAPASLADVTLDTASGTFTGHDLTLTWLKGVTPVMHLDGAFDLRDLTTIVVTGTAGEEGGVVLKEGSFTIGGLSARRQTGTLDVTIAGTVPDVLAVLNAPPLSLLRAAPPGVVAATGDFTAHVGAHIPFINAMTVADTGLTVDAMLHNLAFVSPLAPLAFSAGEGRLNVTATHLAAQATALFAGAPAKLKVSLDYGGPEVRQDISLDSAAGAPVLAVLGLDPSSLFGGPVTGTAPFSLHVSGPSAQVSADLTPVAWELPRLGWAKTAGQPGHVDADVVLHDGAVAGVESLAVTAPDLAVAGSGTGGRIEITSARIGRSNFTASVAVPNNNTTPWRVSVAGTVLDFRMPNSKGAKPTKAAPPAPLVPPSGPQWTAAIAVQTMDLAAPPAPGLHALSVTASGQGGTVLNAEGTAQGLNFTISPASAVQQTLLLHADDAGELLRVLDVYGGMEGGSLALTATLSGGLAGDAQLTTFRIQNAPGVAKLLQAVTVYGLREATSGPGLAFDHAEIPFTFANGLLTLKGARAFSSSLGFTANGSVDLSDNTCDVEVTTVPAYALNTLPGRIPLLGRLFSAERGGGLLAVRAHVTGALNTPEITVNPFSALTPGVLRDVFGLGP